MKIEIRQRCHAGSCITLIISYSYSNRILHLKCIIGNINLTVKVITDKHDSRGIQNASSE